MSDTEFLDKPKTVPARRLEVFTGVGRRRSWTAEQKAQIVAESYGAGATVCAVARRHALTAAQLSGWRRKAELDDVQSACAQKMEFASVVVAAPSRQDRQAASTIEVAVGSLTVRVPVGADPSTLQLVLRAARAVS